MVQLIKGIKISVFHKKANGEFVYTKLLSGVLVEGV